MIREDPDELWRPRLSRWEAACHAARVDTWLLTTMAARRFVEGEWDDEADLAGELDTYNFDAGLPAGGRVAVDRVDLTTMEQLRALGTEVVDAGPILAAARRPRAAAEQAVLIEGHQLTELAVKATMPRIRVGMTERDVSGVFAEEAVRAGLTDPHIDQVWTVLPKSARDAPWAWLGHPPYRQLTSSRALVVGDLLALDAGYLHHGYMTDVGWTFVVGRESNAAERRLSSAWRAVAERVEAAVRPGATAVDLREAALDGWHGGSPPWPFPLYVAHGVGWASIEPPLAGTDLPRDAEAAMVIEPGMLLLIEPYVWEEGVGGFRAELAIEVTDDGSRRVSRLPVWEWRTVG
ncbi:MAG: Xaa-Pro aminopeptidase [Acidimicrobiales bacterium]|jgi:Xaa-Pro dipeptidase|nr:Xaa-Pro aminopeptidase [Acidimicrobiales bacterium]